MSEEETKSLRIRVYELTNSNNAFQQENANLQTRVSELYTWSQQAQQVIKQRDDQIQTLTIELNTIRQKEQERLQNRSEVTVDDLYEQVQRLEVNNRELEEQSNAYYEIIETVFINSGADRNVLSRIEQILRREKDPQKILLIEMKKNPSASYSELSRTTGLTEQKVKIAADQLRRKGLVKEFGSGKGVAFAKSDIMPTLTDVSEWKKLTSPKELFNALIEYTKVTDQNIQISEALKQFRDILTSLIGTPSYMYEISKSITDFRMRMQNKDELINRIITWQEKWEISVRGVEVYGTTIEDPSSWNGLSPEEIFSSMSRFTKKATNKDVSSALDTIRDILHEKHGHAIYLAEIAREASRWRMSPQNKNDLLQKLNGWKEKAIQR
ncbi:MAG: hypothetical protein ACXADY_04120 [Candidatus Hodarchaeales archaeon]